MATSKTLTPTNVTISIPAMTDSPDASVFSNCVDKEADAINALNSNINSHSNYASSIVTDDVTINNANKKTLDDFVVFYFDFETTSAKSAMDNVMHGLPYAINSAPYGATALGHTPDREPTTYRFSITGDGYLKTLDAIPNGTRIRLTLAYFTA